MANPIIFQALDKNCETWSFVAPDYTKSFVEALKAKVPSDCRTWLPSQKCWHIDGLWVDFVADLAKNYWPESEVRMVEV